jgi:hypothetical protein
VLTNLAAPGSPGTGTDGQGHTVLRLALPGHECYLLIEMAHGLFAAEPMVVDTVLIEPAAQRVSLTWRSVLAKAAEAPIARLQARLRSRAVKARDNDGARLDRTASSQRLTRRLLAQALGPSPAVADA